VQSDTATEPCAKGVHFFSLNEHAVRLAEMVVEAVPCAEQVRNLKFTGLTQNLGQL
jgi:glutamate-1-semialdehyde aminotransferase